MNSQVIWGEERLLLYLLISELYWNLEFRILVIHPFSKYLLVSKKNTVRWNQIILFVGSFPFLHTSTSVPSHILPVSQFLPLAQAKQGASLPFPKSFQNLQRPARRSPNSTRSLNAFHDTILLVYWTWLCIKLEHQSLKHTREFTKNRNLFRWKYITSVKNLITCL